jgi:DNA-binding NarL/FixJ family response regulator
VSPIRVLAVDGHEVVRVGLRTLLGAQPDVALVGEAADAATARHLAAQLAPDVVVAEVAGPANGEVLRLLCAGHPDRKVLALTACEDGAALRAVMTAGAIGYVLKRSGADELLRAIRAAADGTLYRDPAVAEATVGTDGTELSEREREVVCRIALGYSNKEIAGRLKISVKTVETYKTRSMEKLGLQGRVGIVRYVSARGWLVPEPPPDPVPVGQGDRPAA